MAAPALAKSSRRRKDAREARAGPSTSTSLEAARSEVARVDRELEILESLILKGGAAERINAKTVQLETRKGELEGALAETEEPPPLLHPEMATICREQVTALHLALGAGDDQDRAEAAERLRSVVSKIVLTPEDGKLAIDVPAIWPAFSR